MWRASHVASAHVCPMTAAQRRVPRRLSVEEVSASLTRVTASLALLWRMGLIDCVEMDNAYRVVRLFGALRASSVLMECASLIHVLTSRARVSRAAIKGAVSIPAVSACLIKFVSADVVKIHPA